MPQQQQPKKTTKSRRAPRVYNQMYEEHKRKIRRMLKCGDFVGIDGHPSNFMVPEIAKEQTNAGDRAREYMKSR